MSARRAPNGAPSNFVGRVLDGTAPREPNGCILWPYALRNHYPVSGEHGNVGRFILEQTQGPAPSPSHSMGHALHEVCGHRHCIAPEHISWQTWGEQRANQRMDGSFHPIESKRGEAHHNTKQTDDEVRAAVAMVRSGSSLSATARRFGTTHGTVRNWVYGLTRQEALEGAAP